MSERFNQRVTILGGMSEYVGQSGTIIGKEGRLYRVQLDEPVLIPSVGLVRDDLWEGKLLRRKSIRYNPAIAR